MHDCHRLTIIEIRTYQKDGIKIVTRFIIIFRSYSRWSLPSCSSGRF